MIASSMHGITEYVDTPCQGVTTSYVKVVAQCMQKRSKLHHSSPVLISWNLVSSLHMLKNSVIGNG